MHRLLTFGSHYLQTFDHESDIDAILCTYGDNERRFWDDVSANFLDHGNGTFFDTFYSFLKKQD